jgi:hypothetical protein
MERQQPLPNATGDRWILKHYGVALKPRAIASSIIAASRALSLIRLHEDARRHYEELVRIMRLLLIRLRSFEFDPPEMKSYCGCGRGPYGQAFFLLVL